MSQLLKHLNELPITGRQGLGLYIDRHYEEIEEALRNKRSWSSIAAAMAADGQRNAFGEPLKPKTVRAAFVRRTELRKRMARQGVGS
jgi:hypothetical protein